jgi:hypothetical protein
MAKRDYKEEYREYQGTPEQRKRNDARKKARRLMEKKGLVRKGDGKDVDHIRRNVDGKLDSRLSNLRVQSPHKNRGRNK